MFSSPLAGTLPDALRVGLTLLKVMQMETLS